MSRQAYSARVVGALAVALILPVALRAQTPITLTTVSASLPSEVVDGSGADLPVAVADLPLGFFDDFSWRSFIALNWPALAGERGEPDLTKSVGDAGPRVWETWKSAYEIFQSTTAGPTPWSSFDSATPCPGVAEEDSGTKRVLGSFSAFGFGDFNQAEFGDFLGPLIAQNRTYVRYEIKVNQAQYEFITQSKLHLKSTLANLIGPQRFPDGSIEIKAAWMQFGIADDAAMRSRYYRTTALVFNPQSKVCEEREVGLVGLHIVHKTPLRPQWVWSSFEHVSNVPTGVPPAGSRFNIHNTTKQQATDAAPPVVDATTFSADPEPIQVVRAHPLIGAGVGGVHARPDATVLTNNRYRAALAGTVWENYQLVMTQWPTKTKLDPSKPSPDSANENLAGAPFPSSGDKVSIANTALETYVQSTSCMRCHDMARRQNTDFVFFLKLHAITVTEDGAPTDALADAMDSLELQKFEAEIAKELGVLAERSRILGLLDAEARAKVLKKLESDE